MMEAIKRILLLIKEHFPFFFLIVITLCIIFNIYIYKYYKNEDDYVLPKFTNVSISIDGGRHYKQNIMMFNNSFLALSNDLLSIKVADGDQKSLKETINKLKTNIFKKSETMMP